jgi:hypothetical protein
MACSYRMLWVELGWLGLMDFRMRGMRMTVYFWYKTKRYYLRMFGSEQYKYRVLYISRIALAIYGFMRN